MDEDECPRRTGQGERGSPFVSGHLGVDAPSALTPVAHRAANGQHCNVAQGYTGCGHVRTADQRRRGWWRQGGGRRVGAKHTVALRDLSRALLREMTYLQCITSLVTKLVACNAALQALAQRYKPCDKPCNSVTRLGTALHSITKLLMHYKYFSRN